MVSYYKLELLLKERKITLVDLARGAGIGSNQPQRFTHNLSVSMETLEKVCNFLQASPHDLFDFVDEDKLELYKLQCEKEALERRIAKLNN